jgi:hypothetical protein
MPEGADDELRRLLQRRAELIDALLAACDGAGYLAVELELFAEKIGHRPVVAKMLAEAARVRDMYERVLRPLQNDSPIAPDDRSASAGDTPSIRDTKPPRHLRIAPSDTGRGRPSD